MYISRSISISYIATTQKNDENQTELKQTSEMNAVHINCYTKINKIPVICTTIRDEEYITEQYMTEQYTSVHGRTGYNSIWQYMVEQDTTVHGRTGYNSIWQLGTQSRG